MARKPSLPSSNELFLLNPGYDKRGDSPWHRLDTDVPQKLLFALAFRQRIEEAKLKGLGFDPLPGYSA